MFFRGIIGIFQVLFLPGLILCRATGFKSRWLARLIVVVITSLVFNYCLVFFLTAFHLYSRLSLGIILFCEILVLIWQYRNELNQPIGFWLEKNRNFWSEKSTEWRKIFQSEKEGSILNRYLKILYIVLCLILAYISLNWICKLFVWNLGSVFNSYDTIAHWNKWALDWTNNTLPKSTWRYPQLLPANWSVLFVLVGDPSIQFFAQAIMPLFAFFILIMIVDLGFAKKNPGFFLGAAITYLTFKKFLGSFLIEGLADLPSAFFAFSAVYLLFIFQVDNRPLARKTNYGLFIAVAAGGCAVTKQVGLVFLLLFCILYFLFYARPLLTADRQSAKKVLSISLIILFVIVFPWYAYKQVLIWRGIEKSEVQMIVGATQYAYNFVGFNDQLVAVGKSLGKYLYLLIFLIPMTFFMDPLLRSINIFLVFPLFISWGLFASYDFRNLSIALPFFSISAGLSIQYLVDRVFELFKKIPFSQISGKILLILLIILIFLAGKFEFPNELLAKKQEEGAMNAFAPSINQKVIDMVKMDEGNFSIITNYPLENLPGMEGKKVGILFNDYEDYRYTLKNSGAGTLYLLVPGYAQENIMNEIWEKINNGDYLLMFEDETWIPYLFVKVINK